MTYGVLATGVVGVPSHGQEISGSRLSQHTKGNRPDMPRKWVLNDVDSSADPQKTIMLNVVDVPPFATF